MPQYNYHLKWKYLISNQKSSLSEIFKEKSFSDVTLVSDDQIPFPAHRYVLSAFSPVLKNILLNNPHSHPLIFLRGVNHQELDSILQFIYLGKASVYHGNMRRFAQAAKGSHQNVKTGKFGNFSQFKFPPPPPRIIGNFLIFRTF